MWNFTVECDTQGGRLYHDVYNTLNVISKNNKLCIASKGHDAEKSIWYMKKFGIYKFFDQVEIIPSDNKSFPFNTVKKRRHIEYIKARHQGDFIYIDDNIDMVRDVCDRYGIESYLYEPY